MCHLVLLMPLFGLAVFWILPLEIALPLYILILLVSGILYYSIMKAMMTPVTTGAKGMIGLVGKIVENKNGKTLVRVHNELWYAENSQIFHVGDSVYVNGIHGLHLDIKKAST
jgi:membrane protein implicated in regulation of membrane protease activity